MRQFLLTCSLALCSLFVQAEVIDIDNAQLAKLMQDGVPVIDIRLRPKSLTSTMPNWPN